jgi:SAM-dependent methyltransferase
MASLLNDYVQKVAMQRAHPVVEPLLPWLMDGTGRILDFGCGLGHVGFLISEQTKRGMEYLDVRKYPFACPGVEIKVFNRKEIPYPDKTFDTSLIIFVLHHVPKPLESLREIIRVSNREIVICEDLVRSKNELISEGIKDNFFLPHMTMQYRIDSDWEKMFTEMGLIIKDKVFFNTNYIFKFKHVAWRLSVP